MQTLRRWLTRDMSRTVACRGCGDEVLAERYRCGRCRAWRRSPFPLAATLVLAAATIAAWVFWQWELVPTLAELAARDGGELPLPLQIVVYVGNLYVRYYALAAPAPLLLVAMHLGFLWRPHRPTGPRILLAVAVAAALAMGAIHVYTWAKLEAAGLLDLLG